MKLNQLTLAVLAATSLLVACSDEPKKPAKNTNTEEKASTEPQSKDIEVVKPAENGLAQQAEERYRATASLVNEVYQKMYGQNPLSGLKKYQTDIADYQRGDNGATATSSVTIEFAPHFYKGEITPITLKSLDTITYNQELLSQGIVARVEGKLDLDNLDDAKKFLKAQFNTSDDNIDKLVSALKHVKVSTDLLTDNNAVSTIEITPFQVQEGDDSLDFKGLKQEIRYNEKTLPEGILALNLNLEPITFTLTDKRDNEGGSATIALSSLSAEYAIKEDGSLSLKTSPFKAEATAKNGLTVFEMDGIEGHGNNVKYESAIMTYLGDIEANANNLRVTHNGEQYRLGDFSVKVNAQKTANGNYDLAETLTFKIDGATAKKIQPEIPVEPQSLRLNIKLSEYSAKTNQAILDGVSALQEGIMVSAKNSDVGQLPQDDKKDIAATDKTDEQEKSADIPPSDEKDIAANVPAAESAAVENKAEAKSDAEVAASAPTVAENKAEASVTAESAPAADYEKIAKEHFSVALQEIIKNKTRFDIEIEGQTDSGRAIFTSSFGIRADSTTTAEEWQQAGDDFNALAELLKSNLDLHAEARISKSLTDKLGFTLFLEAQGSEFITTEGEDYVAKFANDNGTLTINGKPLPF